MFRPSQGQRNLCERGWIFRCKPLTSNDRILAELEKFTCKINDASMSLNQRVPGSSPGAPTKLFNSLGTSRDIHSDKRSAAIVPFGIFRMCRAAVTTVRHVLRAGMWRPTTAIHGSSFSANRCAVNRSSKRAAERPPARTVRMQTGRRAMLVCIVGAPLAIRTTAARRLVFPTARRPKRCSQRNSIGQQSVFYYCFRTPVLEPGNPAVHHLALPRDGRIVAIELASHIIWL